MGLGYSKDKNIDLYFDINKKYYIPGEYVEGKIYLNVQIKVNTAIFVLKYLVKNMYNGLKDQVNLQ